MKETKHRSTRWVLGVWALVLAAALLLAGCGGASDAAAPAGPSAATDQSSASSRRTPGAVAQAAQTDRITDQFALEKNVSGVWGKDAGQYISVHVSVPVPQLECTIKHTKKITILHSNDLHGDFLAEQVDEKLVGGVSMLSGYIEKVRAEEPNTIYAIAGDMFRGSVIDSEYKGLSTIEIMNALAPDVVTIGNHEVDYGIAHLMFIEKCARFPIINANLYIKNTPTRLFTSYKILRMDDMNILFIGIITQDVINQTKSESLVGSFVDTAAAAAEVGKMEHIYPNAKKVTKAE